MYISTCPTYRHLPRHAYLHNVGRYVRAYLFFPLLSFFPFFSFFFFSFLKFVSVPLVGTRCSAFINGKPFSSGGKGHVCSAERATWRTLTWRCPYHERMVSRSTSVHRVTLRTDPVGFTEMLRAHINVEVCELVVCRDPSSNTARTVTSPSPPPLLLPLPAGAVQSSCIGLP
jgi:hypothetical protein